MSQATKSRSLASRLLAGQFEATTFGPMTFESDPNGGCIYTAPSNYVPNKFYLVSYETEQGVEVIEVFARSAKAIAFGERPLIHRLLGQVADTTEAARLVHAEEFAFYSGSVHPHHHDLPAPSFEQIWEEIAAAAISSLPIMEGDPLDMAA